MRPIIQRINLEMLDLSPYARSKICSCKVPCTEGITLTFFNDGNILCWNESRKYMYDLIKVLGADGYTAWTPQEEQYIIDKFEKDGMYRGFNREVATALGKTYAQTKSKVIRMRQNNIF